MRRNRINKRLSVLFCIILVLNSISAFSQVKESYIDYDVFIGDIADSSLNNLIILRKFTCKNDNSSRTCYFAVDVNTLETKLVSSDKVHERSWVFLMLLYSNSNYIKLFQYIKRQNNDTIYNAGLKQFPGANCFAVTTDLCPSSSPFEKKFYENYNKLFSSSDTLSVPIGISISGLWIKRHLEELKWLIEQEKSKKIAITWINHSYHHEYIKGNPLTDNFFLLKNTNIKDEVLDNEKLMLQNGLTPSIYFRFPGLVSDSHFYSQILAFGLIPLGSDSWIAKKQYPKKGSIVLLHGNGNEPAGIKIFLNWVEKNKTEYCISSINKLCGQFLKSLQEYDIH